MAYDKTHNLFILGVKFRFLENMIQSTINNEAIPCYVIIYINYMYYRLSRDWLSFKTACMILFSVWIPETYFNLSTYRVCSLPATSGRFLDHFKFLLLTVAIKLVILGHSIRNIFYCKQKFSDQQLAMSFFTIVKSSSSRTKGGMTWAD